MANDNTISEILDRLDMESYLDQEGIDYKRTHGSSGEQLNLMTCPCCGNSKWKVFLNADTGLGNCFSGDCNVKFNKWKFIAAHNGLEGKPLIEYIKSMGVQLGWRPARKVSTAVTLDVVELKMPTSYPIPIEGRNMRYLKNRNISSEIAQYFHLRYCDKGWFVYKQDGNDRYMKFDSRIIIPIFDLDGKLVSFQGRDITGSAEKKYLFPPGFAVTGKHLYNGHNVTVTKRVVVGEGAFDVMAMKIALDEDEALRDVIPIGTFGKHLSEDQMLRFAELKERGVQSVTFMWDSEIGAIDAAITAGNELKRRYGFEVKIARLPKGCDPNEVVPQAVRDAYYGALLLTKENAVRLKIAQRNL